MLRFTGRQAFEGLLRNTGVYDAPIVSFQHMGDIHPSRYESRIQTQLMLFDRCDKNFIYYWSNKLIDRETPPQTVILNSHPCEMTVLPALAKRVEHLVITDHFRHYGEQWGSDLDNLSVMQTRDWNNLLETLEYTQGFWSHDVFNQIIQPNLTPIQE